MISINNNCKIVCDVYAVYALFTVFVDKYNQTGYP